MVVKKKITQIAETDIGQLIAMARACGKRTTADIAVWIISVSPLWRSRGHDRIIDELETVI